MKKFFLSLVFAASMAFSQSSEPITDIDRIYLGFTAFPFDLPAPDAYVATFTAVEFWYLTGSQVPDPSLPTSTYASAWYNPESDSQYNEMIRVAFNGTPLTRYDHPRLGPVYYMKRPSDFKEDWINWYAYLETDKPISFDQTVSLSNPYSPDSVFPAVYQLNIADSITIGGSPWEYNLRPGMIPFKTADYGQLKLYPNQTRPEAIYLDVARPVSPGRISGSLEAYSGMIDGADSWSLGINQGLVGFSACNEYRAEVERQRFLFKACSIVVKPVSINVTKPN